ncbi:MAG TPA: ERF family protein, partial [Candidatus Dormibacteraeota bacterium]|nr:ERF family protein [Candidatus Dormibacteraeota bacterium]
SENPQQMGSQVTYARRYSLLAITGVAAEDEDDDGGAAAGQRYAQRANRQRAAAPAADEGRTAQRSQRPRSTRPPLPGEDPGGPVGQDQHRHMHALWRELGYDGDGNRDKRLAITARLAGLAELESSADLTRAQADQVIAALNERKAATAGADQ